MVLGPAFSFVLTGIFFVDSDSIDELKSSVHTILIVQTCIVTTFFLFFQIVFRDKPEFPPSAVALAPEEKLNLG